jgi:hypothetical protein
MKEFKIVIPEGLEIDKENSTFEKIIFKEIDSPMNKVFKYHNITEEKFNEDHKNCSEFVKAIAIEELIVSFYNKGEVVDVNNSNQSKYYLWFYIGDDFRLYGCVDYVSDSDVPARLLFIRREDALEASKIYLEQYRNSRNK